MGKHEKTRLERLVDEYGEWCDRWRTMLQREPGFHDQVRRAWSSLVANVGEGLDSEQMGEKRRYFGYALASAGEGLRLLANTRHGVLPKHAIDDGMRILRDIKWDLIRLIRWTKR